MMDVPEFLHARIHPRIPPPSIHRLGNQRPTFLQPTDIIYRHHGGNAGIVMGQVFSRKFLPLLIAAFIWGYSSYVTDAGVTSEIISSVVSLSGGALLANLVSVTILVAETITIRR